MRSMSWRLFSTCQYRVGPETPRTFAIRRNETASSPPSASSVSAASTTDSRETGARSVVDSEITLDTLTVLEEIVARV